jgi:hypothetical protein
MELTNPIAYDDGPNARHPSPPLLVLALVHVVLFIAGVLLMTVLSGGDRYPSPFGDASDAVRFFSRHDDSARIGAFCVLASAIPLGLFAATASSRLRFLGVRAAGEAIAFYGGIGAAVLLLVSGACTWAMTGIADQLGAEPTVRGLQLVGFIAGGPGMVALFGLLIAGVSVTGGMFRLLPSWLVWLGIVTAGIAELSTLALILEPAAYLVPLARVLGCVWLIGAAVALPTVRGELDRLGRGRAVPLADPAHQPA